jgi:purine-binding chemotaxis protein CheW
MSKSVDDTVVDFFNLLLMEKSEISIQIKAAEPVKELVSSQAMPFKELKNKSVNLVPRVVSQTNIETKKSITVAQISRDVDKKALEKLLEAVSTPTKSESIEEGIKAKAELIRQAIKLQPASKKIAEQENAKNNPLVDKEIIPKADIKPEHKSTNSAKLDIVDESGTVASLQTQTGATPPSITKDLQEVLDDEFQVLFFNVAGLTLAVPLVSLGGIVKIERINHIIGRPNWFKGVQTHRDAKLNVVDTCAWVMPEKYSQELAESIDYQYLVLLEDSEWGLACESLVNAVKINKSHVNWRDKPGKRPWLAGVVKEQMCGILHVQALIEMLDAGLGCQDSIDRG